MSIRIALTHKTTYRYDRKINLGPQTVRLRPAPHTLTPIVSYTLDISPDSHFMNWRQDPFGNYEAHAVFPEKTDHLEVTVDLVADMVAINPFDFFLEDDAFHTPFQYAEGLAADLAPYLTPLPCGPKFDALAAELNDIYHAPSSQQRTIDFLVTLNQRVYDLIGYIVRMEPGVQTPEDTLSLAKGSCRDSAWLLVNLFRRLGIAARFVSGYLVQLTADEIPTDGPSGPDADFTDLHAWAEVFIPGAGWIGLDATSGLFAGEGHIPLAATPTPGSAAPISGALEPCDVTFDFDMQVSRLIEPARITKPMTALQFADLDAAGESVDAILKADDVRLTMGGEPTFVAASDRDAEEWNIDAVGPTKQKFADRFLRDIAAEFAPEGLLSHGQGKWYPGEALPRWAYSVVWRKDGQPMWADQNRIAQEPAAEPQDTPAEPTPDDAESFMTMLAADLGVDPACSHPLYEDPTRYLVEETKLPTNLTPETNKLDHPMDRARLARVFERGLEAPIAMVMPLQLAQSVAAGRTISWMSEIWETRQGKLLALPGDSAAGFRLPMKSLPHLEGTEYPHVYQPDPFDSERSLPETTLRRQSPTADDKPENAALAKARPNAARTGGPSVGGGTGSGDATDKDKEASKSVRTALVVEPRGGALHVFVPPVATVEGYVDLIGAVERTAQNLDLPIRIEGYPPPSDPRLNEIKVTPDPGVIEVNIHPSENWADLKETTEKIYASAKRCGLDSAGFQTDGRPQGSGGGAHVVVGGARPEDSPFLRRPDVLASLIRLWQRHPCLSYFFSGLFIGPTSQAPRVDESRGDLMYELELALSQLPDANETGFPPWHVDRILRHLLVDVTGNTHRAEICIDKLYSPDGPAGRLGLVEFRAFEMPPQAEMSLAQQLLVRALIAYAWRHPVKDSFKLHGAELHDKFMLPDVLWADLCDVLDMLQKGLGVRFDPEWFRAQLEFRFPVLGRFETDDIEVELRSALEPWHVLGEEGAASGMTRFVDSSLNRLQLKVSGNYDPERHQLLCNQAKIPLHKVSGARVGGVRFRTWLPVSALHPTIPATPELVFDLYSSANERAVSGATYWAIHPGGRNFETRPVNALEAEARIRQRFFEGQHTPGHFTPRHAVLQPHTPWTLDLRSQTQKQT